MKYNTFFEVANEIGLEGSKTERPVVCVQGLGFVGTAMAVAVANACDLQGRPFFNVIGLDLASKDGLSKIDAINNGRMPFKCEDSEFSKLFQLAYTNRNLIATADPEAYALASTILVDVNLDIRFRNGQSYLPWDDFRAAIRALGEFMPAKCLVIVESTVAPGTCEKIVAPILAAEFKNRGLPADGFLLAHSYERVMPGKEYLNSIVNFYRVYSGYTSEAADACEAFLSKVINVKDYPLTRLDSTTASEIGKVLENSYRAVNIAFMEEWGRFAEAVGIDLFEVVAAIRKRPTHCNIRQPGFGVGGYCLTKDPLMAEIAARELFALGHLKFPSSCQAVAINRTMPLVSLDKIQALLGGSLQGKSLLLLGVSYRQDVGDTRNSPSQIFVENARARGAVVLCHDPYVEYWEELAEPLPAEIPSAANLDAVVLAVPHEQYLQLDLNQWLGKANPLIFDANNVLSPKQLAMLKNSGRRLASIGRGDLA
jgi:UDP-N-acetyl-D-glucosamine dehydrogenase